MPLSLGPSAVAIQPLSLSPPTVDGSHVEPVNVGDTLRATCQPVSGQLRQPALSPFTKEALWFEKTAAPNSLQKMFYGQN